MATASAVGVSVITSHLLVFNVTASGTLYTDMPDTVDASGGDNFTYSWNLRDNSLNDLNFTVTISVDGVSTNDVKINLLDNESNLIASSLTGSLTKDFQVKGNSWLYSGSDGKIEIQFNQSIAPGTYNLHFNISAGQFDWRI